jgi:hypothetical protein
LAHGVARGQHVLRDLALGQLVDRLRRVLAGLEAGRVGKAEQQEAAQTVVVDMILARLPHRGLVGLQQILVVDAVHRHELGAVSQPLVHRLQQ